ncbi:MAG: toll/interleukin-1 receptor domain-containing protein, partial [Bryobacteraceae bacterium]
MAHDIFISYSNANQTWAESALQLFESHGLSCWMAPRDIRPGSTWAAEIVHGISNARVMMLLLSSASNQSRQVAREVQLADSSQLRIIPVLLEAVKPEGDFVYFLSNTQWLTAIGGTAADHSTTLLAAVGEALNASPPKPEDSTPAREPTVRSSPSLAAAQNPPPVTQAPPRPAPPAETYSSASAASTVAPLTSRPIFWVLIGVAVVLIVAALFFLRPSPKPEEESRQ